MGNKPSERKDFVLLQPILRLRSDSGTIGARRHRGLRYRLVVQRVDRTLEVRVGARPIYNPATIIVQ